jgi:hypothetical protein
MKTYLEETAEQFGLELGDPLVRELASDVLELMEYMGRNSAVTLVKLMGRDSTSAIQFARVAQETIDKQILETEDPTSVTFEFILDLDDMSLDETIKASLRKIIQEIGDGRIKEFLRSRDSDKPF